MDAAQLIIAFTAGALAFLSPCSLPMLPAYISYYLDRGDKKGHIRTSLAFASSMVAGFMLVFVIIGVISSLVVSEIIKWVWLAEPTIGAGLIIIGILTGWTNMLDAIPRVDLPVNGSKTSFLTYGVAYGMVSLGCSLPVFILIVMQGATAGGLAETLVLFAAYGTGAAALIVPLTLTLSLANGLIHERLMNLLPYMKRVNAVVLILAGVYMVYVGLMR